MIDLFVAGTKYHPGLKPALHEIYLFIYLLICLKIILSSASLRRGKEKAINIWTQKQREQEIIMMWTEKWWRRLRWGLKCLTVFLQDSEEAHLISCHIHHWCQTVIGLLIWKMFLFWQGYAVCNFLFIYIYIYFFMFWLSASVIKYLCFQSDHPEHVTWHQIDKY